MKLRHIVLASISSPHQSQCVENMPMKMMKSQSAMTNTMIHYFQEIVFDFLLDDDTRYFIQNNV